MTSRQAAAHSGLMYEAACVYHCTCYWCFPDSPHSTYWYKFHNNNKLECTHIFQTSFTNERNYSVFNNIYVHSRKVKLGFFHNRSSIVQSRVLTEARCVPGEACRIQSKQNNASLHEMVNYRQFTDACVAVPSLSSSDDKNNLKIIIIPLFVHHNV